MTAAETLCPVCQRREPAEGWTVCQGCHNRISDDLFRIDELVTFAYMWTAPRKGSQEGTSRPVAGSRPPLDIAALDAALGLAGGIVDPAPSAEDERATGGAGKPAWLRPPAPNTRDGLVQSAQVVLDCLESWVRMTREEAGLSPWGVATEGREVTVSTLVEFLRRWLPWIASKADYPVEVMASEVKALRWQLESLDPDHERPDGMRVPCPAPHRDHDGRACGYRLAVVMDRAADDIVCPRCSETWSGNRLILVALNDPAVTVWAYPDVIEATLGITPATLRQWHARGHVARLGSRYDVGQVFRRKVG